MLIDFFSQLETLQNLAFWGTWASIASLVGVLYNAQRLSKIARHIDREHEKIVDTIRPFDLYYKIQEAIQLLPQQGLHHSPSAEDRSNGQKVLDGLNASTECLRLYFREVHGLVIHRDNIFLDVAHTYLSKNNPERAMEYYKKAMSRAKELQEEEERVECLYGLRSCFARQSNSFACAVIDRELNRIHSKSGKVDLADQVRGTLTMLSIKSQAVLSILRPGKRTQQTPLPGNWDFAHGILRDLLESDGNEESGPPRQQSATPHENETV
jgi:hypothetical protein